MHFGMTGWMKFSNDESGYYKPAKDDAQWPPPRFMKFLLEMQGEPDCQVAFVDARRLGRIRLIDVEADMMRQTSPLKDNGPDPVIDKDILTRDWLRAKMKSKRVPVKALLLDQANISGVGNWVADEVLYQARIHPEQYSNTFSDEQLDRLYDSLIGVCTTACATLADSSKFPENWLMRHRWNKGKKEAARLPNGEKIVHITVGGRTSAVVPSVQKKTGAVAADVPDDDGDSDEAQEKPQKGKKISNEAKGNTPATKSSGRNRGKKVVYKESSEEEDGDVEVPKKGRKRKVAVLDGVKDEDTEKTPKKARAKVEEPEGRRRSGRKSAG
jgi:formamidopyrimidine-DNA glycosylase